MEGFVDLHCHYIPAIDDGVRTHEEGVLLCQALKRIGYQTVVATPHIRTAMFENKKPDLVQRFAHFVAQSQGEPDMPELSLGAETTVPPPRPRRAVSRSSASSSRRACWTVGRPTSKVAASSRSEGRASPGEISRRAM